VPKSEAENAESLRLQLWKYFGEGTLQLQWRDSANVSIFKDLVGDGFGTAGAIAGAIKELKQRFGSVDVPDTPEVSTGSVAMLGQLSDDIVLAFAVDLGLTMIPGLGQVMAIKDLLVSGIKMIAQWYDVYSIGKTIERLPLSAIGSGAAAGLLGAATFDAEKKSVMCGTYAFGALAAFVDPIGPFKGLAPSARLALKLCWLKAEWERLRRANEMLASQHSFRSSILTDCPFLGCHLLVVASTYQLLKDIDLRDGATLSELEFAKHVKDLSSLRQRALAVCKATAYELPNYQEVFGTAVLQGTETVLVPRLFLTASRIGEDRSTSFQTVYEKDSIWHSQPVDLTTKYLRQQRIRSLGGLVTDFTFTVKDRIDPDIFGAGLRVDEVAWFVWSAKESATSVAERLRGFMRAIDEKALVLSGVLTAPALTVSRDITTDDGTFYRQGMMIDFRGLPQNLIDFRRLIAAPGGFRPNVGEDRTLMPSPMGSYQVFQHLHVIGDLTTDSQT
jgi:hypothetical protein